jgi:hypothetical protein
VSNPHDEHDEPIVLDLVHDAILTDADSVEVIQTEELLDALGPGITGQGVHGTDEPKLILPRDLAKLSSDGRA